MDEVVVTIILNAIRLYKDSKLLARHHSYSSAVALAVLSIEESGKACLVRWKRHGLISRDISNDIRSGHIPKQRILGAYLLVKSVYETAFFDEAGHPVEPLEDDDDLIERAAKAGHKNSAHVSQFAETGAFDFMKMAGLYVDLDANLNIISDTAMIGESDALEQINFARIAIEMARAEDRLHRGMAAVYELTQPSRFRRRRDMNETIWKAIKK